MFVVPIAPYLLDVLDCSDLQRKPKQASTKIKPIQFDSALKISKQVLGTRVFQDGVISQLMELLLQHYSANSYSVSFPELIVPSVVQLKRYLKKCPIPPIRKQFLQLIDKLNANATFILGLRQKLDCSPKDIKEIETFLNAEKSKTKSPLEVYFDQYKANLMVFRKEQRESFFNKRHDKGADDDDDDDDDGDEDDEDGEDDNGDDDEELDEDVSKKGKSSGGKKRKLEEKSEEKKAQKKAQKKTDNKKKKARKNMEEDDGGDIVKDFDIDADDDD
eukprot:TRINITY_DN1928_c0_g1_i1.p1 TRINITY_DN1928_c0_g1~~TRINITY_DN1928_c0_g1_i1.p1  ORF type:complete len:275 (-),score=119.81 TRINITY_DN1928_c0_g1_i1:52-876(-)